MQRIVRRGAWALGVLAVAAGALIVPVAAQERPAEERRAPEGREGRAPEERERSGPREDGGRKPESREATGRRALFLAGPIRSTQEAVRLREVISRVPGVSEVGIQPAERPGVVRLTVAANNAETLERVLRVGREYRLDIRFAEWLDRGREGGNSREREGGNRSAEGGNRETGAARATYAVGVLRSEAEAQKLRQLVAGVPGVREVGLRAGEPGMVLVTLVAVNGEALERAARALRGTGLEVRALMEPRREGERREGERREGERREGERREGERREGERREGDRREGDRPEAERR